MNPKLFLKNSIAVILLLQMAFLIQAKEPSSLRSRKIRQSGLPSTSAQSCNVPAFTKMPSSLFSEPGVATSTQIGDLARGVGLGQFGIKQTTYSYYPWIDPVAGNWYTDCSCFVGYIVNSISSDAYNQVPLDSCVSPAAARAKMWANFFVGLQTTPNKFWTEVQYIDTVQHGDILSWGFQVINCVPQGSTDTGHVMVITKGPNGESPVSIITDPVNGLMALIWVTDASDIAHAPNSENGARSTLGLSQNISTAWGKSVVSKTLPNTGVGLGQIKLGVSAVSNNDVTNYVATGSFILQKSFQSAATIGVGRAN